MNETVMDDLYRNFGGTHGWLSRLMGVFSLSAEEIEYLTWRDTCERWAEKKLRLWDREIEAYGGTDIYFECDAGKQFVILTQLINNARDRGMPETVHKMEGVRCRLKNELMRSAAPDMVVEITDAEIDRARLYPLFRLMGFARPKNIKCPYHDDSNPSFQVNVWGFCHTCRKYIDSIGYLMANRSLTFLEAVKDLANR